ncbi:MAG: hypothetical protein ACREQ8_10300 [Woeseiaceae bacterium]
MSAVARLGLDRDLHVITVKSVGVKDIILRVDVGVPAFQSGDGPAALRRRM